MLETPDAFDDVGFGVISSVLNLQRKRKGRCPRQSVDICPLLVPVLDGFSWLRESRQLQV
jgi:hypothetical protein